jgi:hypothetical protein
MTSRRTHLLAVASVACAALSAVALGGAAIVPALRGSLLATQIALGVTLLAALTTTPLDAPDATSSLPRRSIATYALPALLRVAGVVYVLALGPGGLREARFQLLLSVALQVPLLTASRGRLFAWGGGVLCLAAFCAIPAVRDDVPLLKQLPLLWLALALVRWVQCEDFLRGALPVTDHGRLAPWRHPGPALFATPLELFANSRVFQLLLEPLRVVEMRSDITAVIYVNYLVEAEMLSRFVPEGLELQRFGPDRRYALFSVLTYRHGHFGLSLLGPLRRLFRSPVQTDWRVHVVNSKTGQRGVRFVTNAIEHTAPALGVRMLSEGWPMHVLKRASLTRDADDTWRLILDPGDGSAPDADATLRPANHASGVYREAPLEEPWRSCFGDLRAFLDDCVPQDRAMDAQPWRRRISRQEIHLGTDVDSCLPLVGEVHSESARAIVGDAKPVCFLAPAVALRFRHEDYSPM